MRSQSDQAARESLLARTIRYLPTGAGWPLKTLSLEIPFYKQNRPCEFCGETFLPPQFPASGLVRFCGKSCSAKWRMRQPQHIAKIHTAEVAAKRGRAKAAWFAAKSPEAERELERIRTLNPMADPEVRAKVSRMLKRIGHGPSVRGGNGHGMTAPQSILLTALGSGWEAELSLSLGRRTRGYPSHYKIDLGNSVLKVGIEVDGNSHQVLKRKELDHKKDAKLASLGWTVLRFWNADILSWSDSGMPMASSISTTLLQHGIRVTPSAGS